MNAAIRRPVIANRVLPILGRSTFKYIGEQALLDAVVDYLLSPVALPPAADIHSDTGEFIAVHASGKIPLTALVFKLSTDEHTRHHDFVRDRILAVE